MAIVPSPRRGGGWRIVTTWPRRRHRRDHDRSGAAGLLREEVSRSGVRGSGIAATQTRAVGPFSSIDLAGGNNVEVVVGGARFVVVHADSNLIDHVQTCAVSGTLVVTNSGSYSTNSPMSVEVSVPSLAAVKLSGDGMISVSGIKSQQLNVTVPGDGALYASGTVARLDVTPSGDGEAQPGNLTARQVHSLAEHANREPVGG